MAQFFYKRLQEKPVQVEGQETQYDTFLDSFNTDKVIRSIEMENKQRLVLLDDIHERVEQKPQFDHKKSRITGYTKERNTYQSEIFLSEEDNVRFVELFNK